jgi:hypothetical protein
MYLVICYKPSSDDYCRGCHMASYDSDLQICKFEKEEEVVEWIASLNAQGFRVNEEIYEYTGRINKKI